MHFWSYTMPNFCLLSVPLSTALSCKPCTAATHACVALSHWSDPCFGQITEHCSAKSENKGICLMLNTRLNACLVWVCRFLRCAFSISFASPCTCDKQASRPDCFDASHRLPLFLAVGFPLDADSRRRIIRTEVSASATRTDHAGAAAAERVRRRGNFLDSFVLPRRGFYSSRLLYLCSMLTQSWSVSHLHIFPLFPLPRAQLLKY